MPLSNGLFAAHTSACTFSKNAFASGSFLDTIATSKNSNPLSHDDVNKAIRLTGLTDRKIRGANECSIFSPTISPLHSHFSHLAEDVT